MEFRHEHVGFQVDAVDEAAIDPGVEGAVGGIAFGIVADPAVEVDGHVQRLGAVADEVAHATHDIDDVLASVFDFLGRAGFLEDLEVGKAGFQLRVIFRDRPRQIPDQSLGVVGVLRGIDCVSGVRLSNQFGEVIAKRRQRFGLQTARPHVLEVDIVVGIVEVLQRQIGGIPPAVGFAGEKSDALGGGGLFHEGREVGGQRGEGELVDEPMAFVVPGASAAHDGEKGQRRNNQILHALIHSDDAHTVSP